MYKKERPDNTREFPLPFGPAIRPAKIDGFATPKRTGEANSNPATHSDIFPIK